MGGRNTRNVMDETDRVSGNMVSEVLGDTKIYDPA
jgi:hypothetical protein